MAIIREYLLPEADWPNGLAFSLDMPVDADIFELTVQYDDSWLAALVQKDSPTVNRKFCWLKAGDEVPEHGFWPIGHRGSYYLFEDLR